MLYRRNVQGEGAAILRNGASISRDSGAPMVRRPANDPASNGWRWTTRSLAVTMTLALVGLVMVFSASAIVAGNRFQDPGFF